MSLSVSRTDLVRIVADAAADRSERVQDRLRRVAKTTDAVAFGWFHCDGVGCPARQARYRGQAFQEAFDREMFNYFGKEFDICASYAVKVG